MDFEAEGKPKKKERKRPPPPTPVPTTIEFQQGPGSVDSCCEDEHFFYQKLEEFEEGTGAAAVFPQEDDVWSSRVVSSQCDAYGFPLLPSGDASVQASTTGAHRRSHSNDTTSSAGLLEPFQPRDPIDSMDVSSKQVELRQTQSWGKLPEAGATQPRRASQPNPTTITPQSLGLTDILEDRERRHTYATPESIRQRLGQLSSEFLSSKLVQLAEEQVLIQPPASTPLSEGSHQRRQRRLEKAAKLEETCLLDFTVDAKSFEQCSVGSIEHALTVQLQQQKLQGESSADEKWFTSFPSVSTTATSSSSKGTSSSSKDLSSVEDGNDHDLHDLFQQLDDMKVSLQQRRDRRRQTQ
uniref:Uncharacterized protein n=1 Tax=Cyclophora tenuis TaxID=216820 RepID=A0A7S1D0S3_CYCTE